MEQFLTNWLGRGGFLPHGFCLTWSPGLLWSMVGADAVIAASYYSIPIAIVSFTRRRPDLQFNWLLLLFSAFIWACGTTHVMDIWTLWRPDYGLQSLTKIVTAGVSLVTAVALWPLIPKALRVPSVAQLQSVIDSLEAEVRRHKSTRGQLAEIEQGLAATLASLGAGFISTDRGGAVARMNEVAEALTGWTQAQARGEPLGTVFRRADRPAGGGQGNPVDAMIGANISVDAVQRVTCVARDGASTAVEVRSALTRATDGTVQGMALVFRDVSALEQAEAESIRLAAIVESSNDAIIGKTLEGRITSWNRAAESLFGYTAGEAIGRSIDMLIPPDRAAEEVRIRADLARGEPIPPYNTVRRAKDGTLRDVSVAVSPIRDANGTIVGGSKIARDIGAQKRAEEALRQSEARLRFTLEAAEVGDWELDLATGATRRSALHDRCFGYAEPRADWSAEIFLRHVHPDDRAAVSRQFDAVFQGQQELAFECRVVWPDASLHWISVRGSLRQAPDAGRMLGIVVDITRRKLAEESRLKAVALETENRQIQEASRLKSEFLANMSHELRTPLNAIIGFADLLHMGKIPQGSPKQTVFVDHIRSSGRHLLQLINDVLDLSKVEAGKLEFHPESIELSVLVGDIVAVLNGQAVAKAIAVGVRIDPALAQITIDPQRLKQVLFNYLSNALKFTPAGGSVTVRADAENARWWRLEVEDTGPGIREGDIPRLFTEFQQLDGGLAKAHAGTGLGLALTRRLVEAQGGTVGVRSEVGVGSVFHARLRRDALQAPSRSTFGDLEMPPVSGAPAVLVIEDDVQDAQRLTSALEHAGFGVAIAHTASEALALTRQRAFVAITLDLVLPDRSGSELLADIRASGLNRDVPVLIVTILSRPLPPAAFPVADVLSKPIDGAAVIRALRRNGVTARSHKVVMVVDDDPASRDLMMNVLGSESYSAVSYAGAEPALAALDTLRPAAVILDLSMPGVDGFEFLDRLREVPAWRGLPVFVWTSRDLAPRDHLRLSGKAQAVLAKSGLDVELLLGHVRKFVNAE